MAGGGGPGAGASCGGLRERRGRPDPRAAPHDPPPFPTVRRRAHISSLGGCRRGGVGRAAGGAARALVVGGECGRVTARGNRGAGGKSERGACRRRRRRRSLPTPHSRRRPTLPAHLAPRFATMSEGGPGTSRPRRPRESRRAAAARGAGGQRSRGRRRRAPLTRTPPSPPQPSRRRASSSWATSPATSATTTCGPPSPSAGKWWRSTLRRRGARRSE